MHLAQSAISASFAILMSDQQGTFSVLTLVSRQAVRGMLANYQPFLGVRSTESYATVRPDNISLLVDEVVAGKFRY